MSVRPAESPRVAAAAHSRQMASPSPTGRRLPPLDSRAVWLSPKEWDPTLRRNSTCEVCYRSIAYCPGIDAQCLLCPVVVHITCLDQEERKKAFNNNFLCAFCVDDFEYNRDQFLEQRSSQSQKAKYTCAQITISARWRGYHALKVYRIVMGLIRRLQNAVRARYRVKLLTQYRIGLLRPMHISVLRCNHLAVGDSSGRADPYVLMTIIDTNNTDNQCWLFKTQVRHQSLNPTYFERFMVPGISGKQTVVLTIVDEDDVRHQCLGQASVRMSNPGDLWKDGGSFVLPISRVKYIPKVAGTPLRLDYSSITPEGSIEIKIEPVTNVTANCGYMLGPSLNDLERNFKHIMPSSGITYFDDNGNIGKGTVARPQVIELKKVQLESSTTSMCLRFILKVDTYPTFEFDCIDSTDALCWKLAFYSAWKSTRETEFNFRTLIDSLRKAKKDKETGDPGDDEASVGSLASRRSMSSIGSVSKAPSFTSQQAGSRQGSIGKFKKKKKNRANHY